MMFNTSQALEQLAEVRGQLDTVADRLATYTTDPAPDLAHEARRIAGIARQTVLRLTDNTRIVVAHERRSQPHAADDRPAKPHEIVARLREAIDLLDNLTEKLGSFAAEPSADLAAEIDGLVDALRRTALQAICDTNALATAALAGYELATA